MAHPVVNEAARVLDPGETRGVRDPGTFTAFSDGTATFCGNGETTAEQITGHFIKHRVAKEKDEALKPFVDNQAAATFGAQFFIQQNQHLGPMSPQAEIKEGELFHMDATPLKTILARFADKLPELEAFVANMGSAAAGAGFDAPSGVDKAIGGAGSRTRGRELPTGNV